MTGKTQSDAVNFLRLIPEGSEVELVISRQEEVDEKFKVPRKMADNNLLSKNGNSYVDGDKDNSVDDDGEPDLLPLQPVQNEDATDSFNGKKEEIILHIPLNETGSAGLGVSVKGKTVTTESSSKDLGIFVKTVLQGGAAYKDGHLRVNDQLLEVNGVKLEGLSNASAMEALRLAMIQDGNIPGIISLTVARHIGKTSTPDLSPSSTKSYGSSQSKCQSDSEIGTILLTHKSLSSPEKYMEVFFSSSSNRVQRFSDSGPDSMSESDTTDHDTANKSKHKVNILNTNFKAPLADSKMSTFQNKQRPHSTTGFVHESEKHDPADESNDDIQTSPDDISPKPLLPFEREGMGRQSMSEKRKGHLDPRITEIYKIVKANKEIKEGNKEHMMQVNIPSENRVSVYNSPGIILLDEAQNKANSTAQEFQNENSWSNQHFGRGRACNDSFRAAVDRSYDIQDPALMDTLEEESIESGAYTSLSGRSSISSEMTEDSNSLHRIKIKEKKGNLLKGFLRFGKGRKSQDEIIHRSRSEERSTSRNVNTNDMSKLNRDYKMVHNSKPVHTIDFIPISEPTPKAMPIIQSSQARFQPEFSDSRGHFRSHSFEPSNGSSALVSPSHFLSSSVPKQKWKADPRYIHPAALTQKPKITGNNYEGHSPYLMDYETSSDNSPSEAIMSRAEYIQQLRTLYQHHHRQRHGVYPQENTEENYERQLQELEQNMGSHRYMEKEIQNHIATNEKFYVKKTEELMSSHQNPSNKSFLYSGHILRNSKGSMGHPLHNYQDYLTSTSYTQPVSYEASHNVSEPAQNVQQGFHEQSFKPKMRYYSPSSQYMFPKSNPPFTDFNSAKV
ncbi:Partitioning defective 3 [Bulinus truncatus]|nr:Partitioning defective 3 [Bulinus truncatus]